MADVALSVPYVVDGGGGVYTQPREPDRISVLLDLRGGACFSLEVSLTQWKNLFSFELVGERGALVIEGLGGSYGPERLTLVRRPEKFGVPEIETEILYFQP